MPLRAPIPQHALPVVEAIRRLVPRPVKKARLIKQWSIQLQGFYLIIRWPNSLFGGNFKVDKRCYGVCPMGMIPGASGLSPGWIPHEAAVFEHLPYQRWWWSSSCQSFYKWFDCQRDIDAVLDAIWPQEG